MVNNERVAAMVGGIRVWMGLLARAGLAAGILAAAALGSPGTARAAQPIDELHCLALTVYFEARGEPAPGRSAVAHVVMNRVADSRFPRSVCGVVRQGGDRTRFGCQFTWWCDGRSDRPRDLAQWYTALAIALNVYCGDSSDPTSGALWYHATYVSPAWRHQLVRITRIGQHVFYGERQTVAMRD
jgi:spore germination cell wall hydrolase CwlJ-like protein